MSARSTTTFDRFDPNDQYQNKPVVGDIDYKMCVDKYMAATKYWKRDSEVWTENSARIFNLVLQHYHPELEAELKNHLNWTVEGSDQNCITLLLMIRDMTHNMKESKQSTMAMVECAVELTTTYQKKSDTIEDYFELSTARKDTVNAHGGQAG